MTMKKTKFWLIFLFVMMLSASTDARDRVIKVKDLPAPARSLVKNHFKGRMIVKAEKESNLNGVSYEVTLSNGDEIKFNCKGGWMEIDCKTDAVPVSVVPNAIAVYVKKNYHNVKINKIERILGFSPGNPCGIVPGIVKTSVFQCYYKLVLMSVNCTNKVYMRVPCKPPHKITTRCNKVGNRLNRRCIL